MNYYDNEKLQKKMDLMEEQIHENEDSHLYLFNNYIDINDFGILAHHKENSGYIIGIINDKCGNIQKWHRK